MPRHNPKIMPPTEVRPQTFDPFQCPDSDGPSVRFQPKLISTLCLHILPSQASYESCSWGKPPRPLRVRQSLHLGSQSVGRIPRLKGTGVRPQDRADSPHSRAFLVRTLYMQFSRCIVYYPRPTWNSISSRKGRCLPHLVFAFRHILIVQKFKPSISKVLDEFSCLNCKQESGTTCPAFLPPLKFV
jgi:hypothetical protein